MELEDPITFKKVTVEVKQRHHKEKQRAEDEKKMILEKEKYK